MRRVRNSILAGLAGLAACVAAGEAVAGIAPPGEHNRLVRLLDNEPMVFFVAQGPANSCGQGCNEWIAAVGRLDFDTGQRFLTFIEKLNGRNLPVFFHSRGGWGKAGVEIATALRERRMTVAVGRTETRQCRIFDKKDKACQERIEKGQSIPARLTTKDAQCHSACVFAFMGGSSRRVAADAHLGVHQGRFMSEPGKLTTLNLNERQRKSIQRNLYQELGVNPDLVELEAKAPHERIYILSRNEITRLGLETKEKNFETSWATFDRDVLGFSAAKSITLRTAAAAPEYLTTRLQFHCSKEGRAFLLYRKELSLGSVQSKTNIQVAFDDQPLTLKMADPKENIEAGFHFFPDKGAVMKMGAAKSLAVIEKKEGDEEGLETKLSIAGLEAAAKEFHDRCIPRPVIPSIATVMPAPGTPGLPSWMPTALPTYSPTTPGFSPDSKPLPKITIKTTYRTSTPATRSKTSSKPGAPRVVWVKEPWAIAAKPRVYYSNPGLKTQR